MQATVGIPRPRLNKRLAAISVVIVAAYLLGGASGFVARNAMVDRLTTPSRSIIAASGAADYGSAWNYEERRSGTQIVGGPVEATTANPVFHEPGSRAGGNQI